MPDHATSSHAGVQRQLDRLSLVAPGADILGLDRITRLLARLQNPERLLPPVFHVAGTNGKGSTCAFLRAAMEQAGLAVHVFSSPHLVRYNERIRLAGKLIDDDHLASLLEEVLDVGSDIGASFFEITTAAALLAFSRRPASACVVEVGLGGRLDATNIFADPACCGVAQLGMDHEAFLGDTLEIIAAEKAGIAKTGRPIVTMRYGSDVNAVIRHVAGEAGAPLFMRGESWDFAHRGDIILYTDGQGHLELPIPALPGTHQYENLAFAVAMVRHQNRLAIASDRWAAAAQTVRWPARLQRLNAGPLTDLLPSGAITWLDGGHNPAAGAALAGAFHKGRGSPGGRRPLIMIAGMLANKDARGFLKPMAPLLDGFIAVPVEGHEYHPPADLAAIARCQGVFSVGCADNVAAALKDIARRSESNDVSVLIGGSLYLAGRVLDANGEIPS